MGGNKVRKLEYIMADVARKKATAVVTIGSLQSNHARVTAMVARRLGLKCALVLNGNIPEEPRANFFLNKLLGIEVFPVEEREQRNHKMDEVADELKRKGEIVYKIPLGSSDEIGSFGFTAALEEILIQQKETSINFDSIIIGSSSGGTQAGLEVGKKLFNLKNLRIMGISPDDSSEIIKKRIINITNSMLSYLGLKDQVRPDQLWVDENFIGRGYGIPSLESEEAMNAFAQVEGILLDPVYTAKVAAALTDYCQKGIFKPDENVLFWHTGGLVALFK